METFKKSSSKQSELDLKPRDKELETREEMEAQIFSNLREDLKEKPAENRILYPWKKKH